MTQPTFQTVSTLVRAYLDEAEAPITWQDSYLLPIAAEAQRKVVTLLGSAAAKLLEDDVTLTIPAGRTSVTYPTDPSNPPELPEDFLFPVVIQERASGSALDYGPPLERRRSRLSTQQQLDHLAEWLWKAGRLQFVGATTDRQIRIEYRKRLPSLTVLGPDVTLLIPDSENAIAWRCVMNAEFSRGNRLLQDRAKVEFNEAMAELRKPYVHSMQGLPVRRRPYGSDEDSEESWP